MMSAKQTSAADDATPEHQPYVRDDVVMPEFTWQAVLLGSALGIVFGASSLYLVLKVGMTVSASIPVAVLSITLFRAFSRAFKTRRATILENNIVQTAGSAGESIAFGVGVTMPALMLLGFEMDVGRVMVVSVLGGLLGVLMMIPLRRAFIVKQHGHLKYPEGTACADVLIVGEQGGASAKTVFLGFGIAFVYQFLTLGLKLWKETPSYALRWFKGGVPAMTADPVLMGVGYIVGTRIACIMVAGGVLASFVLTPAIRLFGDGLTTPIFPATMLIKDMAEKDIRDYYVLYIGAGAVAAGGIISLVQALPLIMGSIASGLRDVRSARSRAGGSGRAAGARTDRDLPLSLVGFGMLALVGLIWATTPLHEVFSWIPQLNMHLVGAVLIVLFGFLFVTVSSRLTGEIGSSSNPISGMTVATLLLTCLIFLLLHWTTPGDRLTALSVAAIVCIAASNGGTTSQDLKTGFLVGATPKWQQLAILVGALTSALVIGVILIVLNEGSTVYSVQNLPVLAQPLDVAALTETQRAPGDEKTYHVWRAIEGNAEEVPPGKYLVDDAGQVRYLVDPGINGRLDHRDDGAEVTKFEAPKARLMALITDGILNQKLPWTLVLLGVSISLVLELCGVPSLPFAVGVYLPLSSSTPIFVGGAVRYVADKWRRAGAVEEHSESESDMSPGVLLSTGYIAGGAIAGVVVAFLSFSDVIPKRLAVWQHREHQVTETKSVDSLTAEIAQRELHIEDDQSAQERKRDIDELAREVKKLNSDELAQYIRVPAGTVLRLPNNETYTVPEDAYLGEIAEKTLQSRGQAQLLLNLNGNQLAEPEQIPSGAVLKIPQLDWPAVAVFGGLAAFLLIVALAWPSGTVAAEKPETPKQKR